MAIVSDLNCVRTKPNWAEMHVQDWTVPFWSASELFQMVHGSRPFSMTKQSRFNANTVWYGLNQTIRSSLANLGPNAIISWGMDWLHINIRYAMTSQYNSKTMVYHTDPYHLIWGVPYYSISYWYAISYYIEPWYAISYRTTCTDTIIG